MTRAEWGKVYEQLREIAKQFKTPIILPLQHPRPPGFGPLAPPRKLGEPDFIFIDYPDLLK